MVYYVISTIFYLLFVHHRQKRCKKQELVSNLISRHSVEFKRYRLWLAGHITRSVFVMIACCDIILEIITTSITPDGLMVVNNPGSIWTASCEINAYYRFLCYLVTNMVFALFSWFKVQLVYTSMRPTSTMRKYVPRFIQCILFYIVVTYPVFMIWGSFTLQWHSFTEYHGVFVYMYSYDLWIFQYF